MNNYWLALALSVVLPALPLANSIFLLRRAAKPAPPHWFSMAASGTVFTFSALWMTNSAVKLFAAYQGDTSMAMFNWLALNLGAGPYFAVSLLTLSGSFWARLAWKQRQQTRK